MARFESSVSVYALRVRWFKTLRDNSDHYRVNGLVIGKCANVKTVVNITNSDDVSRCR